ncbi:MFS transporter [Candidatus Bipolaricaulota bacterium]|nr:MFS transporter [Candidatus Bipolaricaulota bacterium]
MGTTKARGMHIATFVSLFIAVAVAMLGIGIIAPILPLYADTFGASGLAVGLVFSAFSVSRFALGPFVGRFSDRVGRKRIMLVGLAAFTIMCPSSTSSPRASGSSPPFACCRERHR